MKTRIEILVDCDIDEEKIESLRLSLERRAWWDLKNTFKAHTSDVMVQANQVEFPHA